MLDLFWNVQSGIEKGKERQNTLHFSFLFRVKNQWERRSKTENRKPYQMKEKETKRNTIPKEMPKPWDFWILKENLENWRIKEETL